MNLEQILTTPDRFLSRQHKKVADYMHEYFGWTKYECQKVYLGLQVLGCIGIGASTGIDKYKTRGEITFGPLEWLCTAGVLVQGLNILIDKHEEKRREYLKACNGEQTSPKDNPTSRKTIMGGMLRSLCLGYCIVGLYASSMVITDPTRLKETSNIMHNLFPSLTPEDPSLYALQALSGIVLVASLVLETYFRDASIHSPYNKKPFFRTAYGLIRESIKAST